MAATLTVSIIRIIFLLIFIAAASTLIHPVFAKDATSSTTKKQDALQKLDAKKEKVENKMAVAREKMATREAALKTKLAAFRDKKKAEAADRVNTNLNKINQNQTDQMMKHLDKMSALLAKLEKRVSEGTADIKDPTAANSAIAAAKSAIASASAAVTAQAEKDYTLSITTESKVKAEVQAKRDELHKDLQTVRKLVVDAKQSVANAIREAKSGQ